MSSSPETIAAAATPTGTSALAVVRASGPLVAELSLSIFGATPPPRVAQRADYRDAGGTLVDEVLFTFFVSPHSYTGEDTLEISCHGNPYIAQRILEDLLQRGCRPAAAGEFTKRAFLHGRLDLSQAEAVMDLIQARSERALAAANQQLRGSLGRAMNNLISPLVHLLARIEAQIDFPEEDLPAEDREAALRVIDELKAGTDRLLVTTHYGELLRGGVRTVIVGEPNAGKSSLLNRLVGRERALVSPEPGTTRDYLEETIEVGSHLIRLIDTAGLNSDPTELERRGIALAVAQAREAHLFLWVIDSARPGLRLPAVLDNLLTPEKTLVVFNKCDLARPARKILPGKFRCVEASALTGEGFEELRSGILFHAESFRNLAGDEVIAINARHSYALRCATTSLEEARVKVVAGEAVELIASDLRATLDAFGEIAGKIDNEIILDRLFSTFCIGK
jgi:tRNA modification GTPase